MNLVNHSVQSSLKNILLFLPATLGYLRAFFPHGPANRLLYHPLDGTWRVPSNMTLPRAPNRSETQVSFTDPLTQCCGLWGPNIPLLTFRELKVEGEGQGAGCSPSFLALHGLVFLIKGSLVNRGWGGGTGEVAAGAMSGHVDGKKQPQSSPRSRPRTLMRQTRHLSRNRKRSRRNSRS